MSLICAQSTEEILNLLRLPTGVDVGIKQLQSAALVTVKGSSGDTTMLLPHEWAREGVHSSRLEKTVAAFRASLEGT